MQTVPEMPPAITQKICERYLDLSGLDYEFQQELFKTLSYNPRALHFFFKDVSTSHQNTLADAIKPSDIRNCINAAYSAWATHISGYLSTTNLSRPADTFFVTCLFSYPCAFDARPTEDGIEVPANMASQFVQTLLNAGAIRAKEVDDSILIYKPKGFLARYLFARPPIYHDQDLTIIFAWLWAASTSHVGKKGHLFEKMLAAGSRDYWSCEFSSSVLILLSEFTIPSSPLYRELFTLLPNGDQLSPESRVAMHPVQQSDVDLDKLPEDKIICVDDNARDSNRLVCPLFPSCILTAQ